MNFSNFIQSLTKWASIGFAILGLILGAFVFSFENLVKEKERAIQEYESVRRLDYYRNDIEVKFRNEIEALNRKIEETEKFAKAVDNLPTDAQARALVATFDERLKTLATQLSRYEQAGVPSLNEKIALLTDRYKKLEDAIVQDAPKAVSIIVMGKELETIKKSIDERLLLQNSAIDRLYTILFGSIFVIALSVISQAISSFFGAKRQSETKD